MTCSPPNNIDSADVAKITNGNNIDEDVTNSPSSAATLVGCQCDDAKSRSERRQSRVVNNCERCDRPLMSSTIVLNGNNNNNYSHNSHNFGSRINNGGGRKPSNRDNNQYDCCNDDDYFTNVNNGNGDDRRYGGSYDDDVHDSSGRGKNNSNHAAPVLSSSSWPGMDRAVDVHDDEVVDELCDLIGISILNNGHGSGGGRGHDVDEERNLSPTPLMSFDYNGYEPPTPIRNINDDGGDSDGGNIFFPQQQQHQPPPPDLYDDNNDHDDDDDDDINCHDIKECTNSIAVQTMGDGSSKHSSNSNIIIPPPPLPTTVSDHDIVAYSPSSVGRGGSSCFSIPTYLHQLSQIVITKISAHPLGHHVLLISAEGLLFSYGSNRYGQLGIGNQQHHHQQQQIHTTNDRNTNANNNNETTKAITDTNHGQRKSTTMTMQQRQGDTDYSYYQHGKPTIVTPLLENGGKTINCAAGVDYSLVVVKTECVRIKYQQQQQQNHHHRARTSRSHHRTVASSSHKHQRQQQQQQQQREYHHQMYGFGNNHDRKLGLLNPDREESSSSSSSQQHHTTRGGSSSNINSNRTSALLPGSPNSIGSLGDASCNTEDTTGGSSSFNYYNSNNNNSNNNTTTTHDEFADCVFLPRRVALHCRVIHEKQPKSFNASSVSSSSLTEEAAEAVEIDSSTSKFPPYGIFSIAASVEHSSALVKRPSGDIEIYTWGGGGIMNMSLHKVQLSTRPCLL